MDTRVYGCMGVWVCECVSAWVYGCASIWVYECMGVRVVVYILRLGRLPSEVFVDNGCEGSVGVDQRR
jgi:hypothetical protein